MDNERKPLSMSKSESIKSYCLSLDSQFLGTSLNKANQQERRIEKLLLSRQYDEAIKCHKKAAEFLLEALKTTKNVETHQLIKLKYEHHKRQPLILEETQRKEKQRKLLIQLIEEDYMEDSNVNADAIEDSIDGKAEVEECYESVEDRADSLLHILKQNTKEENGNITYRIPNLFNYFKANPLASGTSKGKSTNVVTKEKYSKQKSFEKDKIIHELQLTIMTLVKNMYSCEEENKYLQNKVVSLESQLHASKCKECQQSEACSSDGQLAMLFSSTELADSDISNLDFQLNSLQPLPEITMPDT